jgi:hypothetical protein
MGRHRPPSLTHPARIQEPATTTTPHGWSLSSTPGMCPSSRRGFRGMRGHSCHRPDDVHFRGGSPGGRPPCWRSAYCRPATRPPRRRSGPATPATTTVTTSCSSPTTRTPASPTTTRSSAGAATTRRSSTTASPPGAVHGCRGPEDRRSGGDLGRHGRSPVRPLLPRGVRHVRQRLHPRARGQQRRDRVRRADLRLLDRERQRRTRPQGAWQVRDPGAAGS